MFVVKEMETLSNGRYGGFRLSMVVVDWLRQNKGWHILEIFSHDDYEEEDEDDD